MNIRWEYQNLTNFSCVAFGVVHLNWNKGMHLRFRHQKALACEINIYCNYSRWNIIWTIAENCFLANILIFRIFLAALKIKNVEIENKKYVETGSSWHNIMAWKSQWLFASSRDCIISSKRLLVRTPFKMPLLATRPVALSPFLAMVLNICLRRSSRLIVFVTLCSLLDAATAPPPPNRVVFCCGWRARRAPIPAGIADFTALTAAKERNKIILVSNRINGIKMISYTPIDGNFLLDISSLALSSTRTTALSNDSMFANNFWCILPKSGILPGVFGPAAAVDVFGSSFSLGLLATKFNEKMSDFECVNWEFRIFIYLRLAIGMAFSWFPLRDHVSVYEYDLWLGCWKPHVCLMYARQLLP